MRLRSSAVCRDNPALALAECWYWIRKLQARFFAGDYAAAVEASSKAQRLLWTSPSQFETAEYHFYGALSHAASCDSAHPAERQQHCRGSGRPPPAARRSGRRIAPRISRTAPHWSARRSPASKAASSMPSVSTNRPSARRAQTASSTMRRSPTSSPRASTRRAASRRSRMPICRKPGTAISLGSRRQGAATRSALSAPPRG